MTIAICSQQITAKSVGRSMFVASSAAMLALAALSFAPTPKRAMACHCRLVLAMSAAVIRFTSNNPGKGSNPFICSPNLCTCSRSRCMGSPR